MGGKRDIHKCRGTLSINHEFLIGSCHLQSKVEYIFVTDTNTSSVSTLILCTNLLTLCTSEISLYRYSIFLARSNRYLQDTNSTETRTLIKKRIHLISIFHICIILSIKYQTLQFYSVESRDAAVQRFNNQSHSRNIHSKVVSQRPSVERLNNPRIGHRESSANCRVIRKKQHSKEEGRSKKGEGKVWAEEVRTWKMASQACIARRSI